MPSPRPAGLERAPDVLVHRRTFQYRIVWRGEICLTPPGVRLGLNAQPRGQTHAHAVATTREMYVGGLWKASMVNPLSHPNVRRARDLTHQSRICPTLPVTGELVCCEGFSITKVVLHVHRP